MIVKLADSCFDYHRESVFWSVRHWRDIQEAWFKKQIRQLTPAENKQMGDQVLFFAGVIRGVQKNSLLGLVKAEAQKTVGEKICAGLYNTGWCCRVGQAFYSSAAKSHALPQTESRVLRSLSTHFPMWVVALSRIRQQDLLDRMLIS